jgi:hypothetical protein
VQQQTCSFHFKVTNSAQIMSSPSRRLRRRSAPAPDEMEESSENITGLQRLLDNAHGGEASLGRSSRQWAVSLLCLCCMPSVLRFCRVTRQLHWRQRLTILLALVKLLLWPVMFLFRCMIEVALPVALCWGLFYYILIVEK